MNAVSQLRLAGFLSVLAFAAPAHAASDCPGDFVAFNGATEPLACSCSAEAAKTDGSGYDAVWGMDVYADRSLVCHAARHAGVIGAAGGIVTAIPEPGRKAYAGLKRNGIISMNDTAREGSYRFAPVARSEAPASPPVEPVPAAATGPSDCPGDFVAYNGTTEPLACLCPAEAAKTDGSGYDAVWGMDVYADRSLVCHAARHAGVIGADGGLVTAIPEPGRKAYPGLKRNGIVSMNDTAREGSYRFAPGPKPMTQLPAAQVAAPVQAPIAASLRDTGEVQLYVRFRTASAELDPATVPILDELLATMKAQPALELGLIGHTDAVGAREYNMSLSYRRAESVRFWLASHGISLGRVTIDGKGFDEPLADNASDIGRARNRRVQAKRLM